jgi:diketogulonate reductase-like aldo/keto reductase
MDIPYIGFGTYQLKKQDNIYNLVLNALLLGYRHIDTASIYKNESEIGKAIRDSSIPRNEIFVTTKVSMKDIRKNKIQESITKSLHKLNIGYIDLILLHGYVNDTSWNILEQIYGETELIKYIGISNYNIDQLNILLNDCLIKPYCLQTELTPFLQKTSIIELCKSENIKIVSHSTLTKGQKLNEPLLLTLGHTYNSTSAQILLKWAIQLDYIVLPRTSNLQHMAENINLNFNISDIDLALINTLESGFYTFPIYI